MKFRCCVMFLMVAVASAAPPESLSARASKAQTKGVAYLKQTQAKDGSWSRRNSPRDTVLCLFALASSGVGANDPAVVRALAWLDKNKREFEYGSKGRTEQTALLALALARLDKAHFRERIQELIDRLVRSQKNRDQWDYVLGKFSTSKGKPSPRSASGRGELHTTAYAVHALVDCGGEVPKRTWQRVQRVYRKMQLPSGGWPMHAGHRTEYTAAAGTGIAGYVGATRALGGDAEKLEAELRRTALSALRKNLNGGVAENLYVLARAANTLDLPPQSWTMPAGEDLLKTQQPTGGWGWRGRRGIIVSNPNSTAYALLFFSIAKLKVPPPGPPTRTR